MRPLLSVVFVSFKRVDLLTIAHRSFLRHNGYSPVELIVTDDGSSPAEQAGIRTLPFEVYRLSPNNRGLGANMNAGLAAARGKHILVMQDDWETTALAGPAIGQAVDVLEADGEVGMVRFYGDPGAFPLLPRHAGEVVYWVADHGSPRYRPHPHIYSDTPHVRRAALNDEAVLGLYREDVPMEETEQDYAERFDRQARYKVAFLSPVPTPFFLHLGEARSYRTFKLRYRLDNALISIAQGLGIRRGSSLHVRLKGLWTSVRRMLIAYRILR